MHPPHTLMKTMMTKRKSLSMQRAVGFLPDSLLGIWRGAITTKQKRNVQVYCRMKTRGPPPPKKCQIAEICRNSSDRQDQVIQFCKPEQTVNADSYSSLSKTDLRQALRRKHPGNLIDGVVVLHDNAKPHPAVVTRKIIADIGWEVLNHPP